MDLVPKPDQVVSAASNLAHLALYGGLADLRPMPRTLIDEGELREVFHYRPSAQAPEQGDPVLLVTPLAAPALCYDLRRGCSLVEHLVSVGRPTYLVEYGQVSFRNRALGMEHWVTGVVPTAIRVASEHAGGRPVHVVGWSLGGIFAMLAAADHTDLPIASLTVLGTPVDVSQVPLVAPLRPLINLTDGRILTPVYRALGGAPRPLVRAAFQLSSIQRLVTKPVALATRLDDADFLAQVEAVDRFTDQMIAYPGRTFGQLYHRFVKGNALVDGSIELEGHEIDLADITAPVLVFAGATDGIAPVAAVQPLLPLLTGSREARLEIVPGGHLGMLTGRQSRDTTWRALDDWIDEWSAVAEPTPPPASRTAARKTSKRTPAKKAAAKKAATKKAATKKATASTSPTKKSAVKKGAAKETAVNKSAAKKTATKKTAAKRASPAIGTSPRRRYGSAGSRDLAR